MEDQKPPKKKNLQDLQRFLKHKATQKEDAVKAEKLTREQVSDFFENIVTPAFVTLNNTISEYELGDVIYDVHVSVARFRLVEPLSTFIFKVEVDNKGRRVSIKAKLSFRNSLRTRLNNTMNQYQEIISFKELESVSSKFIISISTEWYTNKDENIRRSKATLAKK